MFLSSLLRRLRGNKPAQAKKRRTFVPQLLVLEDRTLPSTFTVMNLNDSGSGSLRQAILDANQTPGADVIQFQSGLTGTITLTSGPLTISDTVTITGPGAALLAIDGNHAGRVLSIAGLTPNGTLSGLSIEHDRPSLAVVTF